MVTTIRQMVKVQIIAFSILGCLLFMGLTGCAQTPSVAPEEATNAQSLQNEQDVASVSKVTVSEAQKAPANELVIGGKAKVFTLVEKTRSASLILIGNVLEVSSDTIVVSPNVVLKGTPNGTTVEVMRNGDRGPLELQSGPSYEAGDEMLLFANLAGNDYEAFGGPQGSLKLQPGWAEQYAATVQGILEVDASTTSTAKGDALVNMLGMEGRLVQLSGLEIIYFEYHLGGFPTEPLIEPATQLAQSDDPSVALYSIQVLSRIADKSAVPTLIELVGASNENIASTASGVLSRMTRANIPDTSTVVSIDSQEIPNTGAQAVEAWQDWWEENQESVVLVK